MLRISEWTVSFEAASLAILLQSVGVAAALVQDGEDMCVGDEHLAERGYYAYLDHPETEHLAVRRADCEAARHTLVGWTNPRRCLASTRMRLRPRCWASRRMRLRS